MVLSGLRGYSQSIGIPAFKKPLAYGRLQSPSTIVAITAAHPVRLFSHVAVPGLEPLVRCFPSRTVALKPTASDINTSLIDGEEIPPLAFDKLPALRRQLPSPVTTAPCASSSRREW
jgi:hypothetical protein